MQGMTEMNSCVPSTDRNFASPVIPQKDRPTCTSTDARRDRSHGVCSQPDGKSCRMALLIEKSHPAFPAGRTRHPASPQAQRHEPNAALAASPPTRSLTVLVLALDHRADQGDGWPRQPATISANTMPNSVTSAAFSSARKRFQITASVSYTLLYSRGKQASTRAYFENRIERRAPETPSRQRALSMADTGQHVLRRCL